MQKISIKRVYVGMVRMLVLCFCACMLTSCGALSSLMSFLISIPIRIIDTVIPG